jgi:DNA-binding LytR/AlgR family response regulator
MVQLDRVRELRGDEAILRDGQRIPVSRRRRAVLEQLLRR